MSHRPRRSPAYEQDNLAKQGVCVEGLVGSVVGRGAMSDLRSGRERKVGGGEVKDDPISTEA